MAVRVIVLDYDGTILDSFISVSRFSTFVKFFCFRYLKWCYALLEIGEILLRFRWPLHPASVELMEWAHRGGVVVGIATDRSLLGVVCSARRSNLNLGLLEFLHVRHGIFDSWASAPPQATLLHSQSRKGAPQGLYNLKKWLDERGICPAEVLMVGDAEQDRIAAAECGYAFVRIDRRRPDFEAAYQLVSPRIAVVPEE